MVPELVSESAGVVGTEEAGKVARVEHQGEHDHPFQGLLAI